MPQPEPEPQAPEFEESEGTESDGEARSNFSARIRTSVKRRAKLYAAANDISLQDLADEALDDWLTRRNG